MLPQRFCPGGRIQGSIGARRQTTAFNCYVSGNIEDSLGDPGGIMDRLKESAMTAKYGGGIGYDFSPLRPRGYQVKKIETQATGPVHFMNYFDTIGRGVTSSGNRFGAQMAILRCDHPDVEEFIRAKQKENVLTGFNISVAVTDQFMEAVAADALFPLVYNGVVDHEIRALDLWHKIMRATWDWAEPGVFFVDTVNKMNNLWYCEQIYATNPCGEQPLPPFGACLLGSVNLAAYLQPQPVPRVVVRDGVIVGPPTKWYFDFDQLVEDLPHIVRGMDNVIDKTIYPIPEQAEEAKKKRRMGIGIMGLANAGEACGYSYGSPSFINFEAQVLATIRDECYRASALLAAEKGPFPLFDQGMYLKGKFIKNLPEDVRHLIAKHGIRNSHLTSIAPTGTISLCADNVSSGIEPVFTYSVERSITLAEGKTDIVVNDYGVEYLGVQGRLSADVTPQEHVDVLLTAQLFVDSAVSKTCNVTGETPWDDFMGIYSQVHAGGGKGCTTYNRDGKRKPLLIDAGKKEETTGAVGSTCYIDPASGRRECA